ncbi:MSCRAMM family protein [Intestinimonas massiliensis (ex Afouda et al. 2020)]|uniref:MSCRAMM family protein n=1 Tax=Intestinimonas massiliensis (ex Afouda et al. 2020) TaxID=1673721 RepID=UPI001030DEDB|nr:carboxypeptidase regulatory-like domain-containing protein [Intestinimonas massiliensis (ex Afouda et al. 2020)]
MADIKQDLYGLEYSADFSVQGIQEAEINLNLLPAPPAAATVTGTVTDGTDPIPNATVKLFDSTGTPFQHTLTDAAGQYTLNDVPAGSYTISAVADGYLLSAPVGVALIPGTTAQVALTCAAEPTLALGAIAGVVTVAGMGTPLAGAKVSLIGSTGTVLAVTYSAADGEFVFYDVADGAYTLTVSADGYFTAGPILTTIAGGSIANLTVAMTQDVRTYNGTVSGVIRDQNGMAVAGCFVGLYQVTGTGETQVETLVATTKTNAQGMYLFGGVTAGQYLVKAKLEQ